MAKTPTPKTHSTTPKAKPVQRIAQAVPLVSPPDEAQRVRMLWVAVIGVMTIVVGGWLLLTRATLFQNPAGANPFRAIFEQVKGVFTNDQTANPSSAVTTDGNDAQLKELRQQVFPQFESSTNQSVNGE